MKVTKATLVSLLRGRHQPADAQEELREVAVEAAPPYQRAERRPKAPREKR